MLPHTYYPHLMTCCGYTSRSIPKAEIYAQMLEKRIRAKKSGDKETANALKLVANTTYGAMLKRQNPLYDAKNGRSVCISGQLFLLELSNHLMADIPDLKIVQLNTDGIMIEFDNRYYQDVLAITHEWEERTGFELEEDKVLSITQRDVNNYIEVAVDGSVKIKGLDLVRGVLTNGNVDFTQYGFRQWGNLSGGAFKINNDACIVAEAVKEYFVNGTPVADSINACDDPLQFQLISKASSKYKRAYTMFCGKEIDTQKVNRVYATTDIRCGTMYKVARDKETGDKIPGLPMHCYIDNTATADISVVDKEWYIRKAERTIKDFLGIVYKRNKRNVNKHRKTADKLLDLLGKD